MKKPLTHLIIAGILLLIAVGAYGVWFVMVDTENAKARALATEIETKSQDASRIAEAKAALAALALNETAVSSHFISPNDVVPFLGSLGSTGAALGSKVDVVSVGADPVSSGQGHLTLSIRITGSFDAVLRTLGAFEYAPYDVSLSNLSFDRSGESGWSAAVTLRVGTGPVAAKPPVKPAS
ncbi:MAG: hypothetical protein AB203_04060 [Parcubacteria bacterium C7867-008]|nr:MAG: hypothetical protein AB203_04060 [Parcubacteria bacterium C7867-008]